MPSVRKPPALIPIFASAILTLVIAMALPHLRFQPGMPLPSLAQGAVVLPPSDPVPAALPMGTISGVVVLVLLVVFLLVILVRAMRGVPWRQLLRGLLPLLWKIALAGAIVFLAATLLPRSAGVSSAEPVPPPRPMATSPLGPIPPFLVWAAAILVAGMVLFLAIRILADRRAPKARSWEVELEKARRELEEGQDVRAVILRCYARLAATLREERGIEREQSMTAGEFERLLADQGLPREPVRALSRLFEAARYSLWQPRPGDEQVAIGCLEAILAFSRGGSADVAAGARGRSA